MGHLHELKLILSDCRVAGLVCALEQGHAQLVDQLSQCLLTGQNLNPIGCIRADHTITCCTRLAIANGHIDVMKAFVSFRHKHLFICKGQNYPYCNLEGGTLALAAFRGQQKMIEYLLRRPAHHMLQKALDATARWENEKAFVLLLSYTYKPVNLTSALSSAASANNGKTIDVILKSADSFEKPTLSRRKSAPLLVVNGAVSQKRTALITAAWEDCGEAARARCRDPRVDFDRVDESGMNALQVSVLECHTNFLASILERDDLDVNVRGRWEETPLILAVRKGHAEVVRLLLDSGKVDTSLRDQGGLTALDIAIMKDHGPIINMLLQHRSLGRRFPIRGNEGGSTDPRSSATQVGRWFQ